MVRPTTTFERPYKIRSVKIPVVQDFTYTNKDISVAQNVSPYGNFSPRNSGVRVANRFPRRPHFRRSMMFIMNQISGHGTQ